MGNVTLVPFTKTAETEDGLVAKLSVRGLVFPDESELRSLLQTVGYWNRKINTRLKYSFSNNAALTDLWTCVGSSQSCGYTTVFAALSLCAWLLKCVRPQSLWTSRVKDLLADYPEVPLSAMGFPADWQKLALWQ